jgi:hypothetical protein
MFDICRNKELVVPVCGMLWLTVFNLSDIALLRLPDCELLVIRLVVTIGIMFDSAREQTYPKLAVFRILWILGIDFNSSRSIDLDGPPNGLSKKLLFVFL